MNIRESFIRLFEREYPWQREYRKERVLSYDQARAKWPEVVTSLKALEKDAFSDVEALKFTIIGNKIYFYAPPDDIQNDHRFGYWVERNHDWTWATDYKTAREAFGVEKIKK